MFGRSVAFYRLLGLLLRDTHEHDGRLVWALMGRDSAAVMLAQIEAPIDPGAQGVFFYLYARDLVGQTSEVGVALVLSATIASPTTPAAGTVVESVRSRSAGASRSPSTRNASASRASASSSTGCPRMREASTSSIRPTWT